MSGTSSNNALKRRIIILGGTLLGLLFFYLAFRDISLSELMVGIRRMDPVYLAPASAIMILIQVVRTFRFQLILSHVCRVRFKDMWDVINIWAAFNMIVPARLGELTKPYLLRQCGAPFAGGLGGVMVERFFDLWGLLTLLALVLWTTPQIPPAYSVLGKMMFALLTAGYIIALSVLWRQDLVRRLMARFAAAFPGRLSRLSAEAFTRLIDGVGVMRRPGRSLAVFLLSVLLWSLFSVLVYLFLMAFDIEAPFLAAITTQVFLCFGVALPSAPGFLGTFHVAGRLALEVFGVGSVLAISFAVVYHVFSLVSSLLLGLFSYLTSEFRFDEGIFSMPDNGADDARPGYSLSERDACGTDGR